jgi:four helix bundle protein
MREERGQGTGNRGRGVEVGSLNHFKFGRHIMSIRSYRDLLVWQKSMDLVEEAYRVTGGFSKHEIYGLSSQVQRATVSIPANIAAGHDRDSTKEYLRHLAIAAGSLAEVETLIIVALRLKYLERRLHDDVLTACESIGRMLRNLQRALRARQRNIDNESA